LIASASLEAVQPSAPLQVAKLGEMTVLARREAPLVDLGTMVVGASRLRTAYADLGGAHGDRSTQQRGAGCHAG
jgi:hypothetical protein